MTDPCFFQQTIIRHGEDIAKHGQALDTLAPNIERIANNVETLTNKLSNMKGFIAGAAACGGAMVGVIMWIVKSLPFFIK